MSLNIDRNAAMKLDKKLRLLHCKYSTK